MKVEYSKRALAQMDKIFAYIARDNVTAAAAVVDKIESCARLAGEFPYAGRKTEKEVVRVLLVHPYPYLLFYMVLPRPPKVRVLSIRHGAMRR